MSTNTGNFSVGPETPEIIGFPSRFVDFPKGIKYWNSRRVWCLTKPFFSHFVHVVFVVKYCNQLLYFEGFLFNHRYGKSPQQFSTFVYVV